MLTVIKPRMNKGNETEQEENDSKGHDQAFHEGDIIIIGAPLGRICSNTPLRRMGTGRLQTSSKKRERLRTACSGSSSGFLSGLRGSGSLTAALGLRRSGGRFSDQLGRHNTGNEELGAVIIKIDRGTLLIGCRNNAQAVRLMLNSLSFCHYLHIILLDHTFRR